MRAATSSIRHQTCPSRFIAGAIFAYDGQGVCKRSNQPRPAEACGVIAELIKLTGRSELLCPRFTLRDQPLKRPPSQRESVFNDIEPSLSIEASVHERRLV